MFTKIYEILTEFLGESKQGSYSNDVFQYQFNCPQCREENDGVPDGKFNLEVNLQLQRFHCWKCGDTDNMKGKISYLIKRYGNSSLYKSYKDEIESIRKTRMYDFNLYSGLTLDIDTDFYLKCQGFLQSQGEDFQAHPIRPCSCQPQTTVSHHSHHPSL